MSEIDYLEAGLRRERREHRRYAATTYSVWLVAAVLAAGWIEQAKGEHFEILNFALATFGMFWAVGLIVGAVMLVTNVFSTTKEGH